MGIEENVKLHEKLPFGHVSAQAAPCTKLFQRKALDFLLPCKIKHLLQWEAQGPLAGSSQGEQQLQGGAGTLIPTGSWSFSVPRWPQQIVMIMWVF